MGVKFLLILNFFFFLEGGVKLHCLKLYVYSQQQEVKQKQKQNKKPVPVGIDLRYV